MTLNRTIPPAFKTIDRIQVPRVKSSALANGIKLYSLSAGSQELTKLEFIFNAGMYHQPAVLIASATNNLLESGTKSFTANQISDGVDFFGSFLELQVDQDHATVTVYSLNKHLDATLRFVSEVITSPVFPEDEFRIYVANKKQKHQINSQKVSVLAKRHFTRQLFGAAHPYGVEVSDADFDRLTIEEVRKFYKERYHAGNCTVIASGLLPADLEDVLNRHFPKTFTGSSMPADDSMPKIENGGSIFVKRDDAVQSAVRIGRVLFNKTHPDYCAFQVLNTVLGGYFGSRLMANIREDKGYTYGIGSGLTNLVHTGYFFISTEVGADVTSAALDEVYKEIRRLQDDLVSDDELETVRNYILGQFLRSVDGPFALADKFRSIWEFGLDYDFFDRYFDTVKSVKPQRLRDLANQYLKREDLLECVVGKK